MLQAHHVSYNSLCMSSYIWKIFDLSPSLFTGLEDDEDKIDINYKHGSYLFLAREETAHLLEENIAVQKEANVKVNRLDMFGFVICLALARSKKTNHFVEISTNLEEHLTSFV